MFKNHTASHLTLGERETIAHFLAEGMSFKEIGVLISRHPSTVAREVKRHKESVKNVFPSAEELTMIVITFRTAPSGSSAHPAPAPSIARIVFNGIVQPSVKSIPWYPALLLRNRLMSVIPAIASLAASMKKPIIVHLLHTRTASPCVRRPEKASIWNPGSLQNWMT